MKNLMSPWKNFGGALLIALGLTTSLEGTFDPFDVDVDFDINPQGQLVVNLNKPLELIFTAPEDTNFTLALFSVYESDQSFSFQELANAFDYSRTGPGTLPPDTEVEVGVVNETFGVVTPRDLFIGLGEAAFATSDTFTISGTVTTFDPWPGHEPDSAGPYLGLLVRADNGSPIENVEIIPELNSALAVLLALFLCLVRRSTRGTSLSRGI